MWAAAHERNSRRGTETPTSAIHSAPDAPTPLATATASRQPTGTQAAAVTDQDGEGPPAPKRQRGHGEADQGEDGEPVHQAGGGTGQPVQQEAPGTSVEPANQSESGQRRAEQGETVARGLGRELDDQRVGGGDQAGDGGDARAGQPADRPGEDQDGGHRRHQREQAEPRSRRPGAG